MSDPYTRVRALIAEEPITGDGDGVGVRADLRRLCAAAARALDACGVGLTLMTADGMRALGTATDPVTERLEELQLTLGEGPCIEAFARRRPVLVPELVDGAGGRWPGYAPGIYALGVRAVFAFPLQVGAARLGVLDVFRARPGSLSADDLALALVFAEIAVADLLDGQQPDPYGGERLDDMFSGRAQLFQAQGMVMVQLGVSLADALARIRAYAYAENRSLGEVAVDIVARRLRFDGEPQ